MATDASTESPACGHDTLRHVLSCVALVGALAAVAGLLAPFTTDGPVWRGAKAGTVECGATLGRAWDQLHTRSVAQADSVWRRREDACAHAANRRLGEFATIGLGALIAAGVAARRPAASRR